MIETIILLAAGILLLVALMSLIQKRTVTLNRAYYQKQWQEIERLLDNEAGYQLAVIQADRLLDRALKDWRFRGQNMGERMKTAGSLLGNQDAVWSAHKLRNRLVHEDTKVSKRQAQKALSQFRSALKKLGAL